MRALDGVDLHHRRGRVRGDHGAVGLGQVDADEYPRLPRPPQRRPLLPRRDVGRGPRDDELARVRSRPIGFVFQCYNLLPRTSALENVAMPLAYQGVGRPERRTGRPRRWRGRPGRSPGSPAEPAVGRPAAARRIARALVRAAPHPGRRADRQPRHADRRGGHRDPRELHPTGSTIVLITHEPDVAASADRQIHVRDGRWWHEPARAGPAGPRPAALSAAARVLTMLGMIIGVGSVVALSPLARAPRAGSPRSSRPGHEPAHDQPGQRHQLGTRGGAGSATSLTIDDATAVGQIPGVAAVAPELSTQELVVAGARTPPRRSSGRCPTTRRSATTRSGRARS